MLSTGPVTSVHAIGKVWAEMLWVVEQKLVAKHGSWTRS